MRAIVLVSFLLLAGCVGPARPTDDDAPRAAEATFDVLTVETDLGTFRAIVFCVETPETCAFMRDLVDAHYYDGRAFGRIIPGFVIQEVDRTGGTTDQPERVVGEFGTNVTFSAGAFGIARDADPDSGGSEFFVMDHPASTLWGNYTAFAQVVEGLEVVHAIARVPAVKTGPASSVAGAPPGSPVYFGVHDRVPVQPVVMTSVTWGATTLSADEVARYPLQIGDTFRSETHRSTLQWPRDVRSGVASELSFFVWTRDTSPTGQLQDPAPPSLDGISIDIAGPAPSAAEAPTADVPNGELRFSWTPPQPGLYQLRFTQDGRDIGLGNVTVVS